MFLKYGNYSFNTNQITYVELNGSDVTINFVDSDIVTLNFHNVDEASQFIDKISGSVSPTVLKFIENLPSVSSSVLDKGSSKISSVLGKLYDYKNVSSAISKFEDMFKGQGEPDSSTESDSLYKKYKDVSCCNIPENVLRLIIHEVFETRMDSPSAQAFVSQMTSMLGESALGAAFELFEASIYDQIFTLDSTVQEAISTFL